MRLTEVPLQLAGQDERQHQRAGGQTGHAHEQGQQAQSQHDVDVEHGVGDAVAADEADDQNDGIQVVIGDLQDVREPASAGGQSAIR